MEHLKKIQVPVCQMLLACVTSYLSACGGSGTPTPPSSPAAICPFSVSVTRATAQDFPFDRQSHLAVSSATRRSDATTAALPEPHGIAPELRAIQK
jgi:hypothetical protein